MDVDEDGRGRGGMEIGCPDVEVEAVFAHRLRSDVEDGWVLIADFAELGGVAEACPCGRGLWRLPAEVADGRRGVGDSFEDEGPLAGGCSFEIALGDVDVRRLDLGVE